MKKIVYSLVALLTLSCGFVSCGSDDDNDITFSTTPEKAAAGTYSGTWTLTEEGATTSKTCEGTITLTPTDSVNCVDITFDAPFKGDDEKYKINATSVANISHANNGFVFNNNVDTNPLGANFAGKIDEQGNIALNFMKQVKEGRKQYTYFFVFEGKKN